jgi:hypothetical protein
MPFQHPQKTARKNPPCGKTTACQDAVLLTLDTGASWECDFQKTHNCPLGHFSFVFFSLACSQIQP